MEHRKDNPGRQVRCTGLSSQYAPEPEPETLPRCGLVHDVADDTVCVLLPEEPPPLTPEAARALLRLLLTIHQQRTT
jgi:hypothetical protein